MAGVLVGTLLAAAAVAALVQVNTAPERGERASEGSGTDTPVDRAGEPGGQVSVFELEPGMCLLEPTDVTAVQDVAVVACEEEHTVEVVASLRMPGGRWLGAAAVDEFAADQCVSAIHSAGITANPDLWWTYFGPSESSWNARNDRTVSCLVVSRGAPLTGLLINAPSGRSNSAGRVRNESGERL